MTGEWDRKIARSDLERRVRSSSRLERAQWKLGRRGAFLVLMGILYMALAWIYSFGQTPQYVFDQLEMPIFVAKILGAPSNEAAVATWAALWTLSGLIAIVTAWWPPGRDDLGFISLWLFSSVWAALNLYGGLFMGAPRAEVVGVIFAIYAATIVIVSGMPDPSPITRVADRDGP